MRLKGKIVQWNSGKAFGFIAPNGGGDHVFIHKTALANRNRTPQINDIITFSMIRDKQNRYCASDATFTGEKLMPKAAKKRSKFSIYLAVTFLTAITVAFYFQRIPEYLLYLYLGLSLVTFIVYAFDKSKAQRNAWRIQESTLHTFAIFGGWPGATIAQQLLRHKSSKKEFRIVFWGTVVINLGILSWLCSPFGNNVLALFS
ncbi:MAG: DUF1294 domain-containing protein [Thalassotalea sp.]